MVWDTSNLKVSRYDTTYPIEFLQKSINDDEGKCNDVDDDAKEQCCHSFLY
jgi:hypothetical protein